MNKKNQMNIIAKYCAIFTLFWIIIQLNNYLKQSIAMFCMEFFRNRSIKVVSYLIYIISLCILKQMNNGVTNYSISYRV